MLGPVDWGYLCTKILAPEGTGWALGAEGAFFYYYFGAEGAFLLFIIIILAPKALCIIIVLQGKQYQGCSSMNLQQYDVLVVWFWFDLVLYLLIN